MNRKIDQLKAILDSGIHNWAATPSVIEDTDPNHIYLVCVQQQVGFCFDKTGEKFFSMYNWAG